MGIYPERILPALTNPARRCVLGLSPTKRGSRVIFQIICRISIGNLRNDTKRLLATIYSHGVRGFILCGCIAGRWFWWTQRRTLEESVLIFGICDDIASSSDGLVGAGWRLKVEALSFGAAGTYRVLVVEGLLREFQYCRTKRRRAVLIVQKIFRQWRCGEMAQERSETDWQDIESVTYAVREFAGNDGWEI